MAGFSQRLEGDWRALQNALRRGARINLQIIHQQMGEALVSNAQLLFSDQVDPQGRPWRKGQKQGGQTLTRTTRLSSSITYKATPKGVEVGTNLKYAAIHQFGGKIKAKRAKFLKFKTPNGWAMKKVVTIPKRPFIGISEADKRDILTIYRNAARGTLR